MGAVRRFRAASTTVRPPAARVARAHRSIMAEGFDRHPQVSRRGACGDLVDVLLGIGDADVDPLLTLRHGVGADADEELHDGGMSVDRDDAADPGALADAHAERRRVRSWSPVKVRRVCVARSVASTCSSCASTVNVREGF